MAQKKINHQKSRCRSFETILDTSPFYKQLCGSSFCQPPVACMYMHGFDDAV